MSFSVAYSFYLNQKNAEDHHDKKSSIKFRIDFQQRYVVNVDGKKAGLSTDDSGSFIFNFD